MKIGVLALQGAFIEHIKILQSIGVETVEVRKSEQLNGLQGLIIPGGESTTIGKIATDYKMLDNLRSFCKKNAVLGTCAGAIFLSKEVHRDQPLLDLMNIKILRNAFGRQISSFETNLNIPILKVVDPDNKPFHAIFIRAPIIEAVNGKSQVLATLPDGRIVAAQEGRWLATSFHPELTEDDRIHRYFLTLVQQNKSS
jgi:5'-phosphate synthase pdxT subunit